jgi:hypothetical protein
MTDTTRNYTTHDAMLLGDTVPLELRGFGHGIIKYTMVRDADADAAKAGA